MARWAHLFICLEVRLGFITCWVSIDIICVSPMECLFNCFDFRCFSTSRHIMIIFLITITIGTVTCCTTSPWWSVASVVSSRLSRSRSVRGKRFPQLSDCLFLDNFSVFSFGMTESIVNVLHFLALRGTRAASSRSRVELWQIIAHSWRFTPLELFLEHAVRREWSSRLIKCTWRCPRVWIDFRVVRVFPSCSCNGQGKTLVLIITLLSGILLLVL